jgi:hypothetical protein
VPCFALLPAVRSPILYHVEIVQLSLRGEKARVYPLPPAIAKVTSGIGNRP